jgi:hypothetical protein
LVETLMPITMAPVVRKGNPLAGARSLRALPQQIAARPIATQHLDTVQTVEGRGPRARSR